MAQANYTPIQLYRSTTAAAEPTAGNLADGELAINTADGKLFYKNSGGAVRLLSIGYGSSTVTPTNGGVQYGTGSALALTAAGSSGQILRSNGAAAPTWENLSALGVSTISFGTTGLTPNSATSGAVTVAGTLATTNGGTGLTSFTANGVIYASSTSALASGSALTFDGTNFATTGTATATKLIPTGNVTAGNGMYLPTTNQLAWSVNGSEGMRLTSTGLGIGTSSPGSRLHIYQTGSTQAGLIETNQTASVLNFKNTSQPSGQPQIGAAGSDLILNTNGSERARIDSSGNLGLGVTPSAWASGIKAFQLANTSVFGSSQEIDVTSNAYYSSTGWKYIVTAAASAYQQNGGAHFWQIAPSGTAGNAITFTQAMTLDASGNLGIGSTSPSTNLVIGGTASGAGSAGSLGVFLSRGVTTNFYEAYDGTKSMIAGVDSNQSFIKIGAFSNHPLAFVTNNGERARIDTSGNLLVGTTTVVSGSNHIVVGSNSIQGFKQDFVNLSTTPQSFGFAAAGPGVYVCSMKSIGGASVAFLISVVFDNASIDMFTTALGNCTAGGNTGTISGITADARTYTFSRNGGTGLFEVTASSTATGTTTFYMTPLNVFA